MDIESREKLNSSNIKSVSPPAALLPALTWTQTSMTPGEAALFRAHTEGAEVCSEIWRDARNRRVAASVFARIPPTSRECELYSGGEVPLSEFSFEGDRLYLTSSYDASVANTYACDYGWVLIIRVPAGARLLPLDEVSVHGDREREVVLPSDCRLVPRIKRKTRSPCASTLPLLEIECDLCF